MATIRKKTAFKKTFVFIIFPIVACVTVLTIINYNNFKKYTSYSNSTKNKVIFTEITNAVEFQDLALNMIEGEIENRLKGYSHRLINEILPRYSEIEKIDLNKIRTVLKMDTINEDIYIINRSGTIINTTFPNDRDLNLFNFGERHKQMISNLFNSPDFKSERFTIEFSTKRLKKYCYQPTNDNRYVIELGMYSNPADETVNFIKKRLMELSKIDSRIKAVDIFISADNPFSLNKDTRLKPEHLAYVKKAIETQKSQSFEEIIDGNAMENEFVYIPRKNTELYKDAVIRITSDKSDEAQVYFNLLISLIVFTVVLILSVTIFYMQLHRHHETSNPFHI